MKKISVSLIYFIIVVSTASAQSLPKPGDAMKQAAADRNKRNDEKAAADRNAKPVTTYPQQNKPPVNSDTKPSTNNNNTDFDDVRQQVVPPIPVSGQLGGSYFDDLRRGREALESEIFFKRIRDHDLTGALLSANKLVKLDSTQDALDIRGNIYEEMGNYPAAIIDYDGGINHYGNYDSVKVLNGRSGYLYCLLGNYELGYSILWKAKNKDIEQMAYALLMIQRYEDAIKEYDECFQNWDTLKGNKHYFRALAKYGAKDAKGACMDMQIAATKTYWDKEQKDASVANALEFIKQHCWEGKAVTAPLVLENGSVGGVDNAILPTFDNLMKLLNAYPAEFAATMQQYGYVKKEDKDKISFYPAGDPTGREIDLRKEDREINYFIHPGYKKKDLQRDIEKRFPGISHNTKYGTTEYIFDIKDDKGTHRCQLLLNDTSVSVFLN